MAVSGNPLRIVVFGGIGSGKSTFAAMLEKLGALVISADEIGHAVLRSSAREAVAERWPQAVGADGIDRAALAAIVFSDQEQLAELEAMTHPFIAAEIEAQSAAAGDRPVVVELPLIRSLLGGGWIWVLIDAPADLRLERAVARGAPLADVQARMAAQPSASSLHARADWTVPNTGTHDELAEAAAELWRQLSGHDAA